MSSASLISLPRITTLVASLLVAVCSGTNYVFSAYAPQLGARLNITHTKLNIIGLGGNLGVYSTGPIWGRVVDRRGPRILLASAFVYLLIGYYGIKYLFDHGGNGTKNSETVITATSFYALVAFNYLTGAGGNAGLTGSVNSTAKTFPDRARATTTGIVLSGFGLSAFFFSSIAHAAYAGDTSAFLLLLALGTSFPMIFGFFLVRAIPLPTESHFPSEAEMEHGAASAAVVVASDAEVLSPLLSGRHHDRSEDVELLVSPPRNRTPRASSRSPSKLQFALPNIYGFALLKSLDFWLLFATLSLLSGTGLMYINNVGSISQALFVSSDAPYESVVASSWQATQVSIVSIMNFAGRIIMGLLSDYTKNKLGYPRTFCMTIVSISFLISQIVAAHIDNIDHLWRASALVGLSYGGVFGLFPSLSIDLFGLQHFSENWGYVSLSPVLGGNIFSVAFGRNLDAHETRSEVAEAVASVAAIFKHDDNKNSTIIDVDLPVAHQCLAGLECYVDSLYVTIGACFVALLLSLWTGWRDWRKGSMPGGGRTARVVWETEEDNVD